MGATKPRVFREPSSTRRPILQPPVAVSVIHIPLPARRTRNSQEGSHAASVDNELGIGGSPERVESTAVTSSSRARALHHSPATRQQTEACSSGGVMSPVGRGHLPPSTPASGNKGSPSMSQVRSCTGLLLSERAHLSHLSHSLLGWI